MVTSMTMILAVVELHRRLMELLRCSAAASEEQ